MPNGEKITVDEMGLAKVLTGRTILSAVYAVEDRTITLNCNNGKMIKLYAVLALSPDKTRLQAVMVGEFYG